ncbi:unnamed protein product [Linum tenue]|uniref:Uncharacterized protein n=1 Tax=Linum tenue TaxID=586396 RepID=A0AAV0M700_9ROSI|nr:unnamed protein product [Linum tenue]
MAASTCVFSSCCYFLPTARLRKSANPIAGIGESEKHAGDYSFLNSRSQKTRRIRFVVGSSSGKKPDEPSSSSIPSWADPNSDEPPPWAKGEAAKATTGGEELKIPFFAYLLASAITAIAAIGSVFEYVNQKPVFGVLESDSIFYAPVLGFFAFTGIPTAVSSLVSPPFFLSSGLCL